MCGEVATFSLVDGRVGLAVALVAAGGMLAGCTGNSTHRSSRTPTTAPTPSTTPTTGSPATGSAEPDFGQGASGPPAFTGARQGQQCSTNQLVLRFGGYVSEPTQQNSLGLTLTNQSSSVCHLDGYPKLALIDSRGRILAL